MTHERRIAWLKVAALTILAIGIVFFVIKGADEPEDPTLAPPGGARNDQGARAGIDGFGEVAVSVEIPGGDLLEWCLLLAESDEDRQRGLMEVTDPDLGGYDGMLFRYDSEVDGGFYMRNTPMPLSIAYIDSSGELVSTADMEPCENRPGCPTYSAAGPYQYAVEVPQDGLDELGLVEGSRFTDTGEECPSAGA